MSNAYLRTNAGNLPPVVATSYITNSGIATPAANILNVLGGDGIITSAPGNSNTITISVEQDGMEWSEETTDFSADPEHGYFCDNALTVTLPSSGQLSIGDTIIIYSDTTDAVAIQTGFGEQIQVGNQITSIGGAITSNTKGAMVTLVFKPSDSAFHVISSMGVWIVT